ncbi:MAG: hypothetical protein AB3N22_21265 [Ruegeria sp.]
MFAVFIEETDFMMFLLRAKLPSTFLRRRLRDFIGAAAFTAAAFAVHAEMLPGSPGKAAGGTEPNRWCAAWWEFPVSKSFPAGTELCVRVVGQNSVLVRLLPEGSNPSDLVGIAGGVRQVPQNGAISVSLSQKYDRVVQISVHGCDVAWGYVLPENSSSNSVSIASVDLVSNQSQCQ